MKKSLFALLACLSVSSVAMAATDYKPEYKMSVVVGSKLPWGEGATKFTDLVRERTNGRINIKVYPSSALVAGKQTNEFLILRQGVADFALSSSINWSSTVKELNLFNLPFFFPDYAALDRVTEGEAGDALKKVIAKKGVEVLAWGENGFRELSNSVRPIAEPKDLKGLKIRVVGAPIFIETMKAFGANPVNMNWSEAKIAFQQGVVDGQENPVVGIQIPVKIWEYHKYLTAWHYAIDPLMFAASKKTWKTFTDEDREIISAAAKEAGISQKAAVRKGLVAPDLSAFTLLEEKKMSVTIPNAEQRAKFVALAAPIVKRWEGKIGKSLVDSARKAIDAKDTK